MAAENTAGKLFQTGSVGVFPISNSRRGPQAGIDRRRYNLKYGRLLRLLYWRSKDSKGEWLHGTALRTIDKCNSSGWTFRRSARSGVPKHFLAAIGSTSGRREVRPGVYQCEET